MLPLNFAGTNIDPHICGVKHKMRAAENILLKFGEAVAALRERLDHMTQLQLARRLEELTQRTKPIDKENIRRWEKGEVMPSGDIVLAIFWLCPDKESLAKFGLDISRLGVQNPAIQDASPVSDLIDTSVVVNHEDGTPRTDRPTRKLRPR